MAKNSYLNEAGQMVIGNPEPKPRKAQHFEGAKVGRFTGDWICRNASLDSLLETGLLKLRARSRHLVDNNPYANALIQQTVSNMVGEKGFTLKVEAKRKGGGVDKTASKTIGDAWRQFCRSENFTVTGDITEQQFDCLMVKSIATFGGGMARIIKKADNAFNFAFQGLPMDLLDPEYDDQHKNIVMSVEKNEQGRPTKYHLLKEVPNNTFHSTFSGRVEVKAESVIHAFMREEFGQTQGKPLLTPVMTRLRQLDAYEEAEVIKARAEASTHLFFETDPEIGQEYTGEGTDVHGNVIFDGSPGTSHNLPAGVSAKLLQPTSPNSNSPAFKKSILRGIASGYVAASYNTLANDLEGVSYSSIRQGVLHERDMWRVLQHWYIDTVKKAQFSAWLEWYLLTGDSPYSIVDFERLNKPEFTPRSWHWVDPDKDSKAIERNLKMSLTSHQREARKMGLDHDTILEERAEDNKNADAQQLDLFLDMPQPVEVEIEADDAN
jgi:lambda family phage portal protein